MKVLILDDEPLLLSLLTRTFRLWGHEVMAYAHPVLCPVFTSKFCPCQPIVSCPDLILTDFDMPHVNGVVFLETLRNKGCRCPHFAMMSGNAISDAMLARAEKLGAKFFTKPFPRAEIKDWVDGLSGNHCLADRKVVEAQPVQSIPS